MISIPRVTVKLKVEIRQMTAMTCIVYEEYLGSKQWAANVIWGEETSKGEGRQEDNDEIQERGSWSRDPAFDGTMQSRNMDDDEV